MAEHSPGPWTVDDYGFLFGTDGELVCDLERAPSHPEFKAGNAYLIRAAPDLLAALKCFIGDDRFKVTVGGNPIAVEAMIAQARAAIAKAEGEITNAP